MEINFTDTDVLDINTKVAEQCLIRASVENDFERKVKSLLFAKRSIDSALISSGIDIQKIEIENGLPSRRRQTLKTNKVN